MILKTENTKVNWFYVSLFYALAFLIAAPFNSGVLSQKYRTFTDGYLLSDWTYLPAGLGTLLAASIVLFLDRRRAKTTTFFGDAPLKNTVIAVVPLLVFAAFGLENERLQNANYYALVFASVNLIYALTEEIGWRGYLQDALRPVAANARYVLIGVLWWAWHFRFFNLFELTIFPLVCIAAAFLIGKFTEETKSFLTAAGLHSFVIILTNSGMTTGKIIAGIATILLWLAIGKWWKTENDFKALEKERKERKFLEVGDAELSPFAAREHFNKTFQIQIVNRNAELRLQIFKRHSVNQNRLVRFYRVFRYDGEIAFDLIFHRKKILTRKKSGNRDIAAEIRVRNGENEKIRAG